jgi:flavodoxin
MGLYYQSVMDKSKLKEANRLHNKIEYLKDQLERISRFEMEGKIQITNSYDFYFYIDEDIVKTYFPMIKESMEKKLEEYERLFSEL